MKKLTLLFFILLCSALLLVACVAEQPGTTADTVPSTAIIPTAAPTAPTVPPTDPPTNPPTDPPTDPPTEPTELIIPLPTIPGNPLEYQPGSMHLFKQKTNGFDFERKYRVIYYTIPGYFFDLLNDEQMNDFGDWLEQNTKETNYGEHQNEMFLVSMIKRYDVPREAFDEAVQNYVSLGEKLEWGFKHESQEIPNADVIYTFDNELINRYYRYE